MEQRQLEVNIISAEDLKEVTCAGKIQSYAFVWIDPYLKRSTQVDKENGRNPVWNEKFMFEVPEFLFQQPNARLTIEIFSQGLLRNKPLGVVFVPLAHILKGAKTGRNELQFLSYQVRRPTGRLEGILNLSIRLEEKQCEDYDELSASNEEPVMAYPAYPPGYGRGFQSFAGYSTPYYTQHQPPQAFPYPQPD